MKTLTFPRKTLIWVIFFYTLIFSMPAWSQESQLAYDGSTKAEYYSTSKIALVDHSRVRNQYKAYCAAKVKMSNAMAAKKKSRDQSIKDLEAEKIKELKADAKKGGKNKQHIINKFESQKAKIKTRYNREQKEISENNKAQMRAYDNKINAVIAILVSQGGFTEVKPYKTSLSQYGVDITSMVLEKLN
jgi:chemotaxis response regulator CheB